MRHGIKTGESHRDETKSQPEAIPVEERNLPAGDVAVPELQSGEQNEIQDVPEVRKDK